MRDCAGFIASAECCIEKGLAETALLMLIPAARLSGGDAEACWDAKNPDVDTGGDKGLLLPCIAYNVVSVGTGGITKFI